MNKNNVLWLIFSISLVMIGYSWYLSYPLSVDSVNDLVFNHISIIYWFTLPIALCSAYLIAIRSKSYFVKWLMSISIFLVIYSLSYFYFMIPGSDAPYFRGLTEYFINTNDLSTSTWQHSYFSWPIYFIFSRIATFVSALDLTYIGFIIYGLIGFLLTSIVFIFFTSKHKEYGFYATVTFTVVNFYFFNYQAVPFSLAFVMMLLLLTIETKDKHSLTETIAVIALFVGIVYTHAFVAIFYVLYQFGLFILDRKPRNIFLFVVSFCVYVLTQFFQLPTQFGSNLLYLLSNHSDYSSYLQSTVNSTSIPLDAFAQNVSRMVTVLTVCVCLVGFLILFIRKQLRVADKAVFIIGVFYTILGSFVYLLGIRAASLVLLSVSLGSFFFLESRFKKYFQSFLLIVLLLFVFIPVHLSFEGSIYFQTKETYSSENFFIDNFDGSFFSDPVKILAEFRVKDYLQTFLIENTYFTTDTGELQNCSVIFYTLGLRDTIFSNNSGANYTTSVWYDNGYSKIIVINPLK